MPAALSMDIRERVAAAQGKNDGSRCGKEVQDLGILGGPNRSTGTRWYQPGSIGGHRQSILKIIDGCSRGWPRSPT